MYINYNYVNSYSILLIRRWLGYILYLAILLEFLFFPSIDNFVGCVMSLFVWLIFRNFFLKKRVIVEHPFSFFVFITIFLARYIPLVATLLEGKPITYGFQNPIETFTYEFLTFLMISIGFYISIRNREGSVNKIQKILLKLNFFHTNSNILWFFGFLGILSRVQQLSFSGEIEHGDVGGKFLAGLSYLQYSPILILFPSLVTGFTASRRQTIVVWIYVVFLVLISFAANSREALIYPIATYFLLYALHVVKDNINLLNVISPFKLFLVVIAFVWGIGLLSDISLAMLANRRMRSDISRTELLANTIETLSDDAYMNQLRNVTLEKRNTLEPYRLGWDEIYLDNFMLNRYGNLRVSDAMIYHTNSIGFANTRIQSSFLNKFFAIFPTPIIRMVGGDLDKDDLFYSPGDMLYATSTNQFSALGGFRVTSLTADGLATFGFWAFPIIAIMFTFIFRLLDCLVYKSNNQVHYSVLGLISIFNLFGMFRNSIGMINLFGFVFRGFWQLCFTYFLVYTVGVFITRAFSQRTYAS